MSFVQPLGLLALIGIPVIVLIYIIKSKYTEQVIPSTYLWELSEKFLKRRRHISKLASIIWLILQCIIVLAIAFAIAQPVFTIPNSAKEYCFILDGTGSMNMQDGSQTRFERAKDEVKDIINKSKTGSNYSLVFIGDTTYTVFDNINNKKSANMALDGMQCTWSSEDCTDAVGIAQRYFNGNSSTLVYLITDKTYGVTQNITVIDVSSGEENYAVTDYSNVKKYDGLTGTEGYLVSANVISYSSDAILTVELVADGNRVQETRSVPVKKLEKTPVEFMYPSLKFASLEIRIKNSDGFEADNSAVFYETAEGDALSVLLVSDSPLYLKSVLNSACNAVLDVKTTTAYEEYYDLYLKGEEEQYGLYVFDCYAPEALPKGSTVWLFNPTKSIPKSGFSFQTLMDAEKDKYTDGSFYEAEFASIYGMTQSAAQTFRLLTKDVVTGSKVAVAKYAKYAVGRDFVSVLMHGSTPLIFAGHNENNDKQVVFAFDLHDSDFALDFNFIALVSNIFEYSSPSVLNQTTFNTGDTLSIDIINGCTALVLSTPSGAKTALPTSFTTVETVLTETGTYKLTATVNGDERVYSLFAGVAETESNSVATGAAVIAGVPENHYANGYYDSILVYLILLAVIFMADWGGYCYEQYQLR